jgi:hypothetical protein
MPYGHFHLNGQPIAYELSAEIIGGLLVHVASLTADPAVRCIAARPDVAVQALKAWLLEAASAPAPTWSRQHASARQVARA